VKNFLDNFFKAFPDLNLTIDEMIAGGDKIAFHATFLRARQGNFMGIRPTGNEVTITFDVSSMSYVQNDGILYVYLLATLVADNMERVAPIPLVLSIHTADCSMVRFHKNGEFVTSVPAADNYPSEILDGL
jgi:hypothetical protein